MQAGQMVTLQLLQKMLQLSAEARKHRLPGSIPRDSIQSPLLAECQPLVAPSCLQRKASHLVISQGRMPTIGMQAQELVRTLARV